MDIAVKERVYTNKKTCRSLGVLPFRASVISFTMNGESDDGGSPKELLEIPTDHHLKPKNRADRMSNFCLTFLTFLSGSRRVVVS